MPIWDARVFSRKQVSSQRNSNRFSRARPRLLESSQDGCLRKWPIETHLSLISEEDTNSQPRLSLNSPVSTGSLSPYSSKNGEGNRKPLANPECSLCLIRGVSLPKADIFEFVEYYAGFKYENRQMELTPENFWLIDLSAAQSFKINQPLPFKTDGLLFMHPDSDYCPGATQYVVHWRIPELSPWDSSHLKNQTVCLIRTQNSACFKTADGIVCLCDDRYKSTLDGLNVESDTLIHIFDHTVTVIDDRTPILTDFQISQKPRRSSYVKKQNQTQSNLIDHDFASAENFSKVLMTAREVKQRTVYGTEFTVIPRPPTLSEARAAFHESQSGVH